MSKKDQILDLAISSADDNLIRSVPVSSMLYDHFLINIDVYLQKQSVSAKDISNRKLARMIFLLTCYYLLWYWIHWIRWIIWWISIIVH
jgi:hypothetical protein